MIAAAKSRYQGIKSINSSFTGAISARIAEKLSAKDQALLEKMLLGPGEFVDNPVFHRAGVQSRLSVRQLDQLISELALKVELLPIGLQVLHANEDCLFRSLRFDAERDRKIWSVSTCEALVCTGQETT